MLDRQAVEEKVLAQVQTWRDLLTGSVVDGRQLLREVLEEPLRFTAEGRTYRFEGAAAAERLLGQVLPPCVASPTGSVGGGRGAPPLMASPARSVTTVCDLAPIRLGALLIAA